MLAGKGVRAPLSALVSLLCRHCKAAQASFSLNLLFLHCFSLLASKNYIPESIATFSANKKSDLNPRFYGIKNLL